MGERPPGQAGGAEGVTGSKLSGKRTSSGRISGKLRQQRRRGKSLRQTGQSALTGISALFFHTSGRNDPQVGFDEYESGGKR